MSSRKGSIRDVLRARGEEAESARRAIHEAWQHRDEGPEARQRWIDSIAKFRAAVDHAWPPGFWDAFERLPTGDPAAIESATLFLEADPWFYRSGYVKAELIRRLKRLPLSSEIEERLRAVVLDVARGRDRREYRAYCRLARKVASPELHAQMETLVAAGDPAVRRRARWMLAAIGEPGLARTPPRQRRARR